MSHAGCVILGSERREERGSDGGCWDKTGACEKGVRGTIGG